MTTPLSYEAHYDALAKIIKALESGQAPLSESLKLFEEGVTHYRQCSDQLEAAEMKVKILLNETLVDFTQTEA